MFDRDGDGGSQAALDWVLNLVAEGEGRQVASEYTNAPPGPIQTKWGTGFRSYT